MDIGHHHKFQASSNWVHQPYNMAMDAAGNMLDHGQNHHHEINPFGHTQWPNYNPNLHNQLSAGNPLEEGGFKLDIGDPEDDPEEELGAMKEMMYKIASMQPVDIDPATIRKPKRRNVRISDDPQSVAARHRRERISERIRILQRLVPGGTKLDTASMLDEAVRYVKFLKKQIRVLGTNHYEPGSSVPNVGPSSSSPREWLAAGVVSSSSMANVGTPYDLFGGNNVAHDHGPVCFN